MPLLILKKLSTSKCSQIIRNKHYILIPEEDGWSLVLPSCSMAISIFNANQDRWQLLKIQFCSLGPKQTFLCMKGELQLSRPQFSSQSHNHFLSWDGCARTGRHTKADKDPCRSKHPMLQPILGILVIHFMFSFGNSVTAEHKNLLTCWIHVFARYSQE